MKMYFIILLSVLSLAGNAQNKNSEEGIFDKNKKLQSVQAACGECKLGLKGENCDLAVRINGKSYFVDGVHIDSLGDAHANDGFCKSIRNAEVQGEIKNDRFFASYFHVLPAKKTKGVKK